MVLGAVILPFEPALSFAPPSDHPHLYTITINFQNTYVPYLVGAMGTALTWSYDGLETLTIHVTSIETQSPSTGGTIYYLAGVIVNFNPSVSYAQGASAWFEADNFDIGQVGSGPGAFFITLTGDPWRTTVHFTGHLAIFVPASAPAHFGVTLNDVVFLLDGSMITATTTTDVSSIVTISGNPVSGRLWTFTFSYSTHTFTTAVNPNAIPEYPLGIPLLLIFMIIAYGVIRRRTATPKPMQTQPV
jgi:hypothetical protein